VYAQRAVLVYLLLYNSYRFRVPHQVCLPGSRSETVRAMRCETCIHAVVTAYVAAPNEVHNFAIIIIIINKVYSPH
jgi:hypothetical protein